MSSKEIEDRILLLEEKMKAVEEFMVSHRHHEEFEQLIKGFKLVPSASS